VTTDANTARVQSLPDSSGTQHRAVLPCLATALAD
jgi:hypothetical protein